MPSVFRNPEGEAGAAPRTITPDIDRDSSSHGKFLRMFGGIWAGVCGLVAAVLLSISDDQPKMAMGSLMCASVALAGVSLWLLGRYFRRSALEVYKNGTEATGVVTRIFQDFRIRMNGRSPWRVFYEFPGEHGEPVQGKANYWTVERPDAFEGQRVVVLHDPKNPSKSVLWTSLNPRPVAPARIEAAADTAVRIEAQSIASEEVEAEAAEERDDARV